MASCYETELFIDDVPEELLCPIGYGAFRDPMFANCGHTLCKGCYEKSLLVSTHCPVCRAYATHSQLKSNIVVKNLLAKHNVKCEHYDKGCSWQGKLSDLPSHVSSECAHKPSVVQQTQLPPARTLSQQDLQMQQQSLYQLRATSRQYIIYQQHQQPPPQAVVIPDRTCLVKRSSHDGSLRWELSNFRGVDIKSCEVVELGGVLWQLSLKANYATGYLSAFLTAVNDSYNEYRGSFYAQTNFGLSIFNAATETMLCNIVISRFDFNNHRPQYCIQNFMPLSEIRCDRLLVQANILVSTDSIQREANHIFASNGGTNGWERNYNSVYNTTVVTQRVTVSESNLQSTASNDGDDQESSSPVLRFGLFWDDDSDSSEADFELYL